MSVAEIAYVSSEFYIFAHKQVQTPVLATIKTAYKSTTPVDRNDLEFYIPANNETYIHPDIKFYVRGKLVSGPGKDMDASNHRAVTKNFLH